MMTYKEAFEIGVKELQKHNIQEAKLDARLLLEFICKTDHNELFIRGDRELNQDDIQQYLEFIGKRSENTPVQYLTMTQEFMGLDFAVNSNVLIPRQDTEVLVEEAMIHTHDHMKILDICTGSGCILLSLMKYKNGCIGVGVDISKKALEVARKNAIKLEVEAEFIQSDLLENVEGKFDIIVSNPPYIQSEVIETLAAEVRNHEPRLALDGKEDGLYFYNKIINSVKPYLNKGGLLLFEIGYDQGEAVKDMMEITGFTHVNIIKDLGKQDRVVTGIY